MQSFNDVWDLVNKNIQSRITDVAYSLWISVISPVEFDGNEVVLRVSSTFQRKIILENYITMFADAFKDVLGFDVSIKILTDEDSEKDDDPPQHAAPFSGSQYTFNTFIVGISNQFAHAACLTVAEQPGDCYNPLFLYGNSGLGKTHLLHAISNRIAEKYPERKQLYCRAEDFTNDMLCALQQGQQAMIEFREKYRTVDVFLVDDVQFIAGKNITEEEFFNTFNTLYNNNKQMVITSDRPPKEIQSLEERIRSRFEQGLIADILPPEFETRLGIIRRKAEMMNFELPDELVFFLAHQLKSNIRQIEGVVKRIHAHVVLQKMDLNRAGVTNIIKDVLNDDQPEPVTIARIISEVSRTYNASPEDIRSKKRDSTVSKARQISIFIVREITGMAVAAIGQEFGGRDHSTVVYAIDQVKKLMNSNPKEKAMIEDLIKNLSTPVT